MLDDGCDKEDPPGVGTANDRSNNNEAVFVGGGLPFSFLARGGIEGDQTMEGDDHRPTLAGVVAGREVQIIGPVGLGFFEDQLPSSAGLLEHGTTSQQKSNHSYKAKL